MKTHTPGPWNYDRDSQEIFSCDETHSCGWIALVGGNDSNGIPLSHDAKVANASLIAAAPDLLESLKRCVSWLSDLDNDICERAELLNAIDAINKAEGGLDA